MYWVGLINIDKEEYKDFLKEGLKIYVGGDTRYGFGELKLIKKEEVGKEELNNWNLNEDGNLKINNEDNNYIYLKNFLEYNENLNFEGEVVLIPEFDFRENPPKIKEIKRYITIGSKLKNNDNINNKFVLYKGMMKG
ncbi:hypothetical protein ACO3VM_03015 [Methanocaldococcus sp. 10A]